MTQSHNHDSVQTLLERHLPALRAFLRLHCGPNLRRREQTGDLVQWVCLEVLQHRERFAHSGELGFRRWLFTTALRAIADRDHYWHAQKRDVAREATGAAEEISLLDSYATFCTPSRDAAAHEELARVEAAFDELPEPYRRVIVLSRIAGLDSATIAQEMATTAGNVRVLLSRALARLAWILAGQNP